MALFGMTPNPGLGEGLSVVPNTYANIYVANIRANRLRQAQQARQQAANDKLYESISKQVRAQNILPLYKDDQEHVMTEFTTKLANARQDDPNNFLVNGQDLANEYAPKIMGIKGKSDQLKTQLAQYQQDKATGKVITTPESEDFLKDIIAGNHDGLAKRGLDASDVINYEPPSEEEASRGLKGGTVTLAPIPSIDPRQVEANIRNPSLAPRQTQTSVFVPSLNKNQVDTKFDWPATQAEAQSDAAKGKPLVHSLEDEAIANSSIPAYARYMKESFRQQGLWKPEYNNLPIQDQLDPKTGEVTQQGQASLLKNMLVDRYKQVAVGRQDQTKFEAPVYPPGYVAKEAQPKYKVIYNVNGQNEDINIQNVDKGENKQLDFPTATGQVVSMIPKGIQTRDGKSVIVGDIANPDYNKFDKIGGIDVPRNAKTVNQKFIPGQVPYEQGKDILENETGVNLFKLRNGEQTKQVDVHKNVVTTAAREAAGTNNKSVVGKFYPVPAGKPATVKQNGVTFIWDNSQGKYVSQ